jgi:alkanesulfonate monooxygenase SsuD/methylene tetrahydromethanopterin reductase-like flavin-dependent oxidoreductase (luciferase family)
MKLSPHYAGMVASGHAVAGSPETVARALTQKAQDGKLNYLVSQFMFGNMPHEHAKRSVGLFSREVMPAVQAASKAWI